VLILLLLAVPLVTRLDVVLSGAGWTSTEAVRRLVSTHAGEPYDAIELDRDLARLRSLGILYDVSAHLDGSRVEIDATDRWSLLPLLGVRRGGGRTTTHVGVTDHNAFGKLFTLYGKLTSNADVPFLGGDRLGSLVYAEVPRVFGTRLTPFLSWTRDFIDFAAFGPGGPGYVYDRARYALRGELRYELSDNFSLMAGTEGRQDRYRTSVVSRSPGAQPSATDTLSALAGVQVGYIEELISQQRGKELRVLAEVAQSGELTATVEARAYFQPAERHNICILALLQDTSGRSESFLFHAGGLREIRGFVDSYFTGGLMARVNAEWRIDVLQTTLLQMPFIGQLAVFTDGGYVGRRGGAVAGLDYEGPILSGGIGLRGIPVPFAGVVGRIDVATGIVPLRRIDVSFSGQRFF
jgi:outer membrane protein assembly factor BamA